MRFLLNLAKFPFVLWKIKSQMKTQNVFIRTVLLPILNKFEKSNDGSLTELDFKKIKNYYGLGSVVLVGEAIAGLHNRTISKRERKALTFVSAITGLYDDFFDKAVPDLERIKKLSDPNQNVKGLTTHESLFRELLLIALENIYNVEASKENAREVYDNQVESLKQQTDWLKWEELLEISMNKGGASMLLYRSTLSAEISKEESDALFRIGGQLQVCNDIFDVVKDLKEGIRTVATKANTIQQLRSLLQEIDEENRVLINSLNLPGTAYFNSRIKFVTSQTFVALDYYEKATQLTGNKFQPEAYKAQQITLSMTNPFNFLKAVWKYCGT